MQFSEKELEDMMYDDLRYNGGSQMEHRGMQTAYSTAIQMGNIPKSKWLRQVAIGPYGIPDIVGYWRSGSNIVIELIELKVVPITSQHFDQILRYKKGISEHYGSRFKLHFWMHLVGPDISDGHYIHNEIRGLSLVEFKYDLTGINFTSHDHGWVRTDKSNFKQLKSLKDAETLHGY